MPWPPAPVFHAVLLLLLLLWPGGDAAGRRASTAVHTRTAWLLVHRSSTTVRGTNATAFLCGGRVAATLHANTVAGAGATTASPLGEVVSV